MQWFRDVLNWIDPSSVTVPAPDDVVTNQELFLPLVNPIEVLEAYRATFDYPEGIHRDEWEAKVGRKRLQSVLTKLGLLTVKNRTLVNGASRKADAESYFRNAVAKKSTIQLTRKLMIDDPDVSPEAICERLSVEFGRQYSKQSTMIREGNPLKVWARWMDPYLIDPEGGTRATMQRIAATSKRELKRGHSSLATPSVLALIEQRQLEGKSKTEVAKELECHPNTLGLWEKKGIIKPFSSFQNGN